MGDFGHAVKADVFELSHYLSTRILTHLIFDVYLKHNAFKFDAFKFDAFKFDAFKLDAFKLDAFKFNAFKMQCT